MIIGIGAIAAVVVAAHLLPGIDNTEVHRQMRNALHVIGFAFVAALIFRLVPGTMRSAMVMTLGIVLVIALSAEMAQYVSGKPVEIADLIRDLSGAVLYLLAHLIWVKSNFGGRSSVLSTVLRSVSLLLFALIFVPLLFVLYVRHEIADQFPVLVDYDSQWTDWYVFPVNSSIRISAANAVGTGFINRYASVSLNQNGWSGIRLEPAVNNWSAYAEITMSARLIGADRGRLSVHLVDGDHPGFRLQHSIASVDIGDVAQRIHVVLEEDDSESGRPPLDLTGIEELLITVRHRGDAEATLLIDNIILIPQTEAVGKIDSIVRH